MWRGKSLVHNCSRMRLMVVTPRVLGWAWTNDIQTQWTGPQWWNGVVASAHRTSAYVYGIYTRSARMRDCTAYLPGTFNVYDGCSQLLVSPQSAVPSAHAVCLFGSTAYRQSFPSRISDLLDVPITENDGCPEHICKKCKRRVERLEKAAEDLVNFRSQANSSYTKLCAYMRGELKQTRDQQFRWSISWHG